MQTVIDHESDNRSRGINALNFRDGEQWEQPMLQSRPDRLNITINHTDTLVTRIENNLKQQRPRIKCHPLNDADVDKALLVSGIVRDIENRSQASVAYDAGASMALTMGWGYWRVMNFYVDEASFEQELRIVPIRNPFTVYKDPASVLPDGSDAMRYIVSEKIKRTKFKQLYPKAKNIEFSDMGIGDGDSEWESRDEIRLAEYYRIVEKPEWLYKLDGHTVFESDFAPGEHARIATLSPTMLSAAGFALDDTGKPMRRRSFRRQVEWYRLNGREVVEKRDPPGLYIPIVLVQGNVLDVNGKIRRKGMVENMMVPARLCNYAESSIHERLGLAPKAPWIAFEGVIEGHPEWHTANQTNQSVLVGKAVTGPNGETLPLPQRTQPASLEQGYTEAMQLAEHHLMAIAGMPHEPGQDSEGEVVSGKAIQQRRALADDAHYQYYDNQTISIAFTGRILFDLIPYYYSTEREQRIIGEDGVPKIVWLNQKVEGQEHKNNDMTIGEYDVVMDTGPGYDTKRLEGAEALTNLMGTPMGEIVAKAAPDIVMRSYDFPYAEEIADRLLPQSPEGMKKALEQLPKQAQNIVQAYQQQMAQLQQHIQQLEADLKYGLTKTLHQDATKLSIEQLHDHRAEQDTATDAHVKYEDTHTKAQAHLQGIEMQVAGKIIDTHVGGKYDEAARKDELKAAEKAEKSNGAAK